MTPAIGALNQALAWLAIAVQELADHAPADPAEVRAVCAHAAELELRAQWCAARAVSGQGGQLTVTVLDASGRLRVVGG